MSASSVSNLTAAQRQIFVTTALPYANGNFHIGHIMEYIQADTWVRAQRMQGHEVHFVCADDAHGAPIMIAAEKAGMAAGDEWWAVASSKAKATPWRLKKLEDLTLILGNEKKAKATITRDQKVFVLDLNVPTDVHTWRLSYTNSDQAHKARTSAWLDGTSKNA